MTAEIVIMNNEAVALAADSAVSAMAGGDRKIFTTADKIFMLCPNKPVGVMIFNSVKFLGVPWETLIYEIGKRFPPDGLNTLDEYIKVFLAYFEQEKSLFPKGVQKELLVEQIEPYFSDVAEIIIEEVAEELKKRPLSDRAIKILVSKVIKYGLGRWMEFKEDEKYSSITLDMSEKILKYYRSSIQEVIDGTFQKIPMSKDTRRNVFKMAKYFIAYSRSEIYETGIVIAGFGEKEVFPSAKCFVFEGMFNDKVKYLKGLDRVCGRSFLASVIPFAQSEMVTRFMEGVDPDYRKAEKDFMSKLSDKLPELIVKNLRKYTPAERRNLLKQIKDKCNNIFDGYIKGMDKGIKKYFTDPITDVVAILPKAELATLAESLVSLTSIKRKFSSGSETVAEPIDVAVISKRDGFVWIRRKSYH